MNDINWSKNPYFRTKCWKIMDLGRYIMAHFQENHSWLAMDLIFRPETFSIYLDWPDEYSENAAKAIDAIGPAEET